MITWNELKTCSIEDIVGYINEKLEENKYNFTKTAKDLGASESTIRKFLTERGYKRVNKLGYELFGEKDDTSNLRSNTPVKEHKEADIISKQDFADNMKYISTEIDTIKDIITWFKNKDDQGNTNVIEVVEGIKIDLPESDIKRTTIRINEKIWNEFDMFCEAHKPYDKHTLMAQALKEYMDRHR